MKKIKNLSQESCLVKRNYGGLGDLLMLSPALKELSKKYKVILQIPKQFIPIFSNEHYLENIISLKIPAPKTNKVFDLSDYEFNYEQIFQPEITKTKQKLFAEALNVEVTNQKPIITLTNKEKKWVTEFLKNKTHNNQKVIVIGPKSANIERDWPLTKWKQLIKKLKKYNFTLMIADLELNWKDSEIFFFNHHSIRELFALVSKSNFVLCQDSGLLHIAGAFEIPNFSIFGPTNPKLRSIYKNSYSLKLDLPCSPCWYGRCSTRDCLNSLSVEEVETKVLEAMYHAIA